MKTDTVLIVLFVIILIAAGPLLAMWSVNTLFNTGIEYTFINWLAAFVLMAIIKARATRS